MAHGRRRVLGVVDTDSFAKWGAHLLAVAPEDWDTSVEVIATPRTASPAQLRSAFRGASVEPPYPVSVDALVDRMAADPPDLLLVAAIGPVAELVIDLVHRRIGRRPVLVTGLPGISSPAKWKGVFHRARADLFVLHSHREVAEYEDLAEENGIAPHFALATLPFARTGAARPVLGAQPDSIVFAAQPSVPALLEERRAVVSWLVETAIAHPDLRIVVKTRAVRGEQQTHQERFAYPDLVPEDAPPNLVVETGPMTEHLGRAVGLVTISSTAVLEAVAAGVPALTLTDFGVGRHLINEVFVDSGLEGTAGDLVAARFGSVVPAWREQNYFHPPADDDWAVRAAALMARRDLGTLVDRPAARRSRGGALRRAWERKVALGRDDRSLLGAVAWAIGAPVRAAKRTLRAVRVVLVGPPPTPPVAPPRSTLAEATIARR